MKSYEQLQNLCNIAASYCKAISKYLSNSTLEAEKENIKKTIFEGLNGNIFFEYHSPLLKQADGNLQLLYLSINNIIEMSLYLEEFVMFRQEKIFLLNYEEMRFFNSKLKKLLTPLINVNLSTIPFNVRFLIRNNIVLDQYQLNKFFNLRTSQIPDFLSNILNFYLNKIPHFELIFNKIIDNNESFKFSPLNDIIFKICNFPTSYNFEQFEILIFYLKIYTQIIENSSIPIENGSQNLSAEKFYLIALKYELLTCMISNDQKLTLNSRLNLCELSKIFDHNISNSKINEHIFAVINDPFTCNLWLKLSEKSKINKYLLLFCSDYNALFEGNHLYEINEILIDKDLTLKAFMVKYIEYGTVEHNIYLSLKNVTTNQDFINLFFNKILEIERLDSQEKSQQAQALLPSIPTYPNLVKKDNNNLGRF